MISTLKMSILLAASACTIGTALADLPDVLWQSDHGAKVGSVQFSQSGRLVASGGFGGDSSARLWDADDGTLLDTFPGHEHGVVSVAISPDERLLAVGHVRVDFYNGVAQTNVYDIQTRQLVYQFGGTLTTFSADGSRIVVAGGGFNRYINVYDLPSATQVASIYTGDYIWGIALSPDETLIATCSGQQEVVLWDINTGLEVRRLVGHEGGVGRLAFSPDGTLIASGVSELDPLARIKIWQVSDGQLLHTMDGHEFGVVNALTFSPDGQTLLSTGRDVRVGGDHSVRLWNVSDGQQTALFPFDHPSYGVKSADYSEDGTAIVIGLGNGAVIAATAPGFQCPPDFNGDGTVNTLDFLAFLNAYNAREPGADFNGDGSINTLDFVAFLNAFAAGC